MPLSVPYRLLPRLIPCRDEGDEHQNERKPDPGPIPTRSPSRSWEIEIGARDLRMIDGDGKRSGGIPIGCEFEETEDGSISSDPNQTEVFPQPDPDPYPPGS